MTGRAAAESTRGRASTQGEIAFAHLRDRIMDATYPPGTALIEHIIADELALSRTPVREALRRLSEAGLVTLTPNQRARVAQWGIDELRNTLDTRVLLESEGARLAAGLISREELQRLHETMEAMESVTAQPDQDSGETVASLNDEFHAIITQACGQAHIIRFSSTLRFQPRMIRGAEASLDFRRRANQQHREIHRALQAGDAQWAEAAMRAHLFAVRHASLLSPPPGTPAE